MRPSGLCRSQNYETRAGANDTQSSRHILKVGIPSPTIKARREWAEAGGTIIRITSRQYIGGVTKRRDQSEWISEGSVAGGFEYCTSKPTADRQ
jgi:hypothetical protein